MATSVPSIHFASFFCNILNGPLSCLCLYKHVQLKQEEMRDQEAGDASGWKHGHQLKRLTLLFLLPTTCLYVINVILLYCLLQIMQRCSPVGLVKVFIHKVRHLQVLGFSGNGVAQGPETKRERLR